MRFITLALVAFLHARELVGPGPSRALSSRAWLLGAAGALLFVTRPEAVGTVMAFGLAIALPIARRSPRAATGLLVRIGLPAACVLALQLGANRLFTGELSANGAIVKLALNNPFMTPEETTKPAALLALALPAIEQAAPLPKPSSV